MGGWSLRVQATAGELEGLALDIWASPDRSPAVLTSTPSFPGPIDVAFHVSKRLFVDNEPQRAASDESSCLAAVARADTFSRSGRVAG